MVAPVRSAGEPVPRARVSLRPINSNSSFAIMDNDRSTRVASSRNAERFQL